MASVFDMRCTFGFIIHCRILYGKGRSDYPAPHTAIPEGADILDYILNLLVIRKETASTESLTELRKQIDECDNDLIELLAKRMRVSREIGIYKKEHEIQVVQTDRYSEILEKRGAQGALCGIDSECVKKIFEAIHEESVRQQLDIINK